MHEIILEYANKAFILEMFYETALFQSSETLKRVIRIH